MTATETMVYDDSSSTGDDGAINQIARTLEAAGMDACADLYREALTLARQGLGNAAKDRLRILLCLEPDDGNAHLLLAKLHAKSGSYREAYSSLKQAEAARVAIPVALLTEVEDGLQKEEDTPETTGSRIATREQAELRALREETRRLRSENTQLLRARNEFMRRSNLWAALTAGVGGVSLVLGLFLVFSGDSRPVAAEELEVPATAALTVERQPEPQEPAVTRPAPEPAVAAAPSREAPAASAGPRVHVVASGDTLTRLAHRYYGDASQWPRIKEANRSKIGRNDSLSLNTELAIP